MAKQRKAQDVRMCLYASKQTIPDVVLDTPSKVVETFLGVIQDKRSANPYYEVGVLFLLNARNELMGIRTFEGTVTHASVYTREIVTAAIVYGAVSAIFVHNHPSGHTEPSSQDIALTRSIEEALGPIDIAFHDHIVVETATPNGAWSSLREMGLMPFPPSAKKMGSLHDEYLRVKSKNHIAFDGDFEYFLGDDGSLFRASISDVLDIHGYRAGARWEAPPWQVKQRLKLLGLA